MKTWAKCLLAAIGALLLLGIWQAWRVLRPDERAALIEQREPAGEALTGEHELETRVDRQPELGTVEPPAPVEPPEPTYAGPVYDLNVAGYRRVSRPFPAALAAQAEACRGGILIDPVAKAIIWARNENESVPIASMTKMMTLLVAVEQIEARDDLEPDSVAVTTPAASSMGGTQVWLAAGERRTLHELMQAMIVNSANDAAYALAEAVAPEGDYERFVQLMNRRARMLGLPTARFFNVHGLPTREPGRENACSALEAAVMGLALQRYPAATELVATRRAEFVRPKGENLIMLNHNRLLGSCLGVNGIKTGFTNAAGFCLTASCERQGRFLMAVVTGFPSKRARDAFVCELLDWGYAQSLP